MPKRREDKQGNRLYKTIELKVILPDERRAPVRQVIRADAGKGFSAENVEEVLIKAAENIENLYPYWEFKLIPRGVNAFTFAYAGMKDGASLLNVRLPVERQ